MTQKVKMPEPVAWATKDLNRLFGENEMRLLEGMGGSRDKQKTLFSVPLITTDQAEAYAQAKVLEARPKHFADGHEAGWCSALEKVAGTILSLNPKD